jgi:chromosome segregation ATPase
MQQQVRDRQEASKKLKEQVNALQSEETGMKKNKAAIDKQLQAALQERDKMKRDMSKWAAEGDGIEQQIKQMAMDEEDYKSNAAKRVEGLKERLAAETATNKSMEDNIRQLIAEIKGVDDATKVLEAELAVQDAEHVGPVSAAGDCAAAASAGTGPFGSVEAVLLHSPGRPSLSPSAAIARSGQPPPGQSETQENS